MTKTSVLIQQLNLFIVLRLAGQLFKNSIKLYRQLCSKALSINSQVTYYVSTTVQNLLQMINILSLLT